MSKRAAAPQPPGYRESGKKPSLPTILWQSHQTARAIFLKEALEADGKMVTSTALLDLDSMLPGSCLQEFVKYKNKVADKLSNIGRSQATQAKRQQKSEALMKLALKKNSSEQSNTGNSTSTVPSSSSSSSSSGSGGSTGTYIGNAAACVSSTNLDDPFYL